MRLPVLSQGAKLESKAPASRPTSEVRPASLGAVRASLNCNYPCPTGQCPAGCVCNTATGFCKLK